MEYSNLKPRCNLKLFHNSKTSYFINSNKIKSWETNWLTKTINFNRSAILHRQAVTPQMGTLWNRIKVKIITTQVILTIMQIVAITIGILTSRMCICLNLQSPRWEELLPMEAVKGWTAMEATGVAIEYWIPSVKLTCLCSHHW